MIKAVLHDDQGKPTLILGLSHENLERLKADQPITFSLGILGFKLVPDPDAKRDGSTDNGHQVLIISGKTEVEIAESLGFENVVPVESGESRHIWTERPELPRD